MKKAKLHTETNLSSRRSDQMSLKNDANYKLY